MDSHCTLTPQPHGLQDWFTDPDGWICRFSANVNVSRLQSKRDDAKDHTCENCSQETKTMKNSHTATQTRPVTPITLHDIIVNGLLVAQKRKDTFRNKEDFIKIFKGTDDFADYDYMLLSTVKDNGRRHILKYIRSKI